MHRQRLIAFAVLLATTATAAARTPTPSSTGPVSLVDTPVLRVPKTDQPPTIDGQMKEGEWRDASALSAFWYDRSQADFRFLSADELQNEVYAAYDRDHLYLAFVSPVYPNGAWLKARARYPDVIGHPNYGLQWDDHVELEFRPYPDNTRGFRLGLFKWFINPIATMSDQLWSINHGDRLEYPSKAKVRSNVTNERWVLEVAMPLESFRYDNYAGKDEDGEPIVDLPIDGNAYRAWFIRGIGGNGKYFNVFDKHAWNTTKTMLVFDPDAVSFQVRELGPIMKDVIDVTLEVKNHSEKSQTVRLGFFIESAEGNIYSSYDTPELNDGQLELTPGEHKVLRLRQAFPGITTEGNVLWFDVRQAGRPAKVLFRTRLIDFHNMDGGVVRGRTYRERRLDIFTDAANPMRPPKKDFDFRYRFSPYHERVSAVVDTGIHGASKEAQSAVEARLMVLTDDMNERTVAEATAKFQGPFATFLIEAPDMAPGENYKLALLLFDENKRIVGDLTSDPIEYRTPEWFGNQIGLDDVVWEPYTPIEKTDDGFDLLKHRYTIAPTGLPAQLYIKPETRDLTLEMRQGKVEPTEEYLISVGRGPQLRQPMRLVATIDGKQVEAEVVEPAKVVRQWKSEIVYASKLKLGPVEVTLQAQYDCDGSMHMDLTYGSDNAAVIERLELVSDLTGPYDLVAPAIRGGGMAGADVWECSMPTGAGVVWHSAEAAKADLFYSRFVPFIFFGSGDHGFSWQADSDRGWVLDKHGPSMRLERNEAGDVSWFVTFVNHEANVEGSRNIQFIINPHPMKPKPENYRDWAWFYRGDMWAHGYQTEPVELTDGYLKNMIHHATGAPRDMSYEQVKAQRWDGPPPRRYGRWRNVGIAPHLDRVFEERGIWWLSKQIRVGRRTGWWWDEYWPGFGRTSDVAGGYAYYRDPSTVDPQNELTWQEGWSSFNMRNIFKRLARVFAEENVPQRQFLWANSQATYLESFAWDCQLVEEAGAGHRSYDIDIITQFPPSLYRYLSKNFSGLVCHLVADAGLVGAGDDPRFERQMFARALMHDFGLVYFGPHGRFQHRVAAMRTLNALLEFGFFEEDTTEYIPYWRNQGIVRFGGQSGAAVENDLFVSVYRRPREGGGYKAIFAISNEKFEPVNASLELLDVQRILGGQNVLTVGELREGIEPSGPFAGAWKDIASRDADRPALMDLETGRPVAAVKGKADTYGPIFIPRHSVRILYAESAGE